MQIQEIMTRNPVCCTPSTSMQEAAQLMADNDCGEIPVLDEQRRPENAWHLSPLPRERGNCDFISGYK